MRTVVALVIIAGLGLVGGSLITSKRLNSHHASAIEQQRAAWEAEKAELEAALEAAREQARLASTPIVVPSTPSVQNTDRLSAHEIVERLRQLRGSQGSVSPRALRQAAYLLEQLVQAGPTAVSAIREFLARNEDIDLETSQMLRTRDRVPLDFALPPSLRLGLFDVLRRIGGTESEELLVQSLLGTGRGIEVSYLASALQEIAPGKYAQQILSAARTLLAGATLTNTGSPLDRNHRDYLFAVLAQFGDTSFVSEAQTQLVRADSQIDRAALRYLQQTLGSQAVPIVAQAYQSPALTNSAGKEPLARLALNFVGADLQANEFYQRTINDPLLTRSHRKNLIEDLNQDGFADTRNLTPRDLPLIENRISLIDQLAPNAMDDANAAAFAEARKDLVNMRAKITGQPPNPPR
jgi:hypothetical protein